MKIMCLQTQQSPASEPEPGHMWDEMRHRDTEMRRKGGK